MTAASLREAIRRQIESRAWAPGVSVAMRGDDPAYAPVGATVWLIAGPRSVWTQILPEDARHGGVGIAWKLDRLAAKLAAGSEQS